MIYKIYNTTPSDITIDDVIFATSAYTVLLDTDDTDNPVLTNGIKIADKCSSDVGTYVTDGSFKFYEDDELQIVDEFYRIANNWTKMLNDSETAFYDNGSGQYFDLESERLKIYNPVTSAWINTSDNKSTCANISSNDIDFSSDQTFYKSITEDTVFVLSNTSNGDVKTVLITVDSTDREIYFANVKWPDNTAVTTIAASTSMLFTFIKANDNIYCTSVGGYI